MAHRPYPSRERALRRVTRRIDARSALPQPRRRTEADGEPGPYTVDEYRISTR